MSIFQLRSHQVAIEAIARRVVAGTFLSNLCVLDCTPGGGKTGTGTILANHLLDAGVIERVLWVVPRLSLAGQVADAFHSGPGNHSGRTLDVLDAGDNIFGQSSLPAMPPTVGGLATYQAIAHHNNWRRFENAMRSYRTLLVLDEAQFLGEDPLFPGDATLLRRGWLGKMKGIQEAAFFTLVMSGTLWRTDNRRLPFVPYLLGDGSKERPDCTRYYAVADITYAYRDAVAERAVLPTEWRNSGALVQYLHNGAEHIHDLLEDSEDEESRKVRTFLGSESAVAALLDGMVSDWREWCRRVYQSRMLVMADTIAEAKRIRRYLVEKHGIACVLATSREEAAGRKLRHFRERRCGQCLVTVAMAYVGFDCPDLTHLAYLSPVRAPSWMLQSFARVSRCDTRATVDYDHQHAFVYAPDDQRMRVFMTWLREQQAMGVADRVARTPPSHGGEPNMEPPDNFEPVNAVIGGRAVESLYRRIHPELEVRLRDFQARCPAAADVTPSKLNEILLTAGIDLSKPTGADNGIAR